MRERDRERAKADGLEICERCGWYNDKFSHASRCNPDAGRVGDALAAEFPAGNPTKLGYGYGLVTFQLDDDLSVTFEVDRYGTVRLRDVFDLKEHTLAGARMIVQCFKRWARPGYVPEGDATLATFGQWVNRQAGDVGTISSRACRARSPSTSRSCST